MPVRGYFNTLLCMFRRTPSRGSKPGIARWALICPWLIMFANADAFAVTLNEKAKESGCVNKPVFVAGDTYRCATQSGVSSYFNVPGASGGGGGSPKAPTPTGFPRVDPDTQKGRDNIRRKVLSDEHHRCDQFPEIISHGQILITHLYLVNPQANPQALADDLLGTGAKAARAHCCGWSLHAFLPHPSRLMASS